MTTDLAYRFDFVIWFLQLHMQLFKITRQIFKSQKSVQPTNHKGLGRRPLNFYRILACSSNIFKVTLKTEQQPETNFIVRKKGTKLHKKRESVLAEGAERCGCRMIMIQGSRCALCMHVAFAITLFLTLHVL